MSISENDLDITQNFLNENLVFLNFFSAMKFQKADQKFVEGLFQKVHSLKGQSGYLGFHDLNDYYTRLEEILLKINKKKEKNEKDESDTEWEKRCGELREETEKTVTLFERIFAHRLNIVGISHKFFDKISRIADQSDDTQVKSLLPELQNFNCIEFGTACHQYQKYVDYYKLTSLRNIGSLRVINENARVDKKLIAKINDPMMHLIRNALEHTTSSDPENRNFQVLITLGYEKSEAEHRFWVRDNGSGLNRDNILKRAIQLGISTDHLSETSKDEEVFNLIFEPGFSTQNKVTEFSGAGVGMGAIRSYMQKLHGKIKPESSSRGACFFLIFPSSQ